VPPGKVRQDGVRTVQADFLPYLRKSAKSVDKARQKGKRIETTKFLHLRRAALWNDGSVYLLV